MQPTVTDAVAFEQAWVVVMAPPVAVAEASGTSETVEFGKARNTLD